MLYRKRAMATTLKSDTDRSIDQILERVLKIEAKLERFSKRLDEVENGYVAQGLQADDKIKDVASEYDSKITSSELRSESQSFRKETAGRER